MLERVIAMHKQFGVDKIKFSGAEMQHRIVQLLEEVGELRDSTTKADDLDALVDLIVFAFVVVDRMGFSDVFEEAFNRVMDANCKKKPGANKKRGSFPIDLVKPEGWKAPVLDDLVER